MSNVSGEVHRQSHSHDSQRARAMGKTCRPGPASRRVCKARGMGSELRAEMLPACRHLLHVQPVAS